MSQVTLDTFQKAVISHFEPIARELGKPLIRSKPDLYEIFSQDFVMRIRFHVGAHTKSINATLTPTNQRLDDVDSGATEKGELGVAVIAGYNGIPIEYIPWEGTEEGFLGQTQYVANMARQYGLPYLLGKKSDWNSVKEYIEEQIKERAEEIKQYKFLPGVQKRWNLPPPQGEDKKI